MIPVPTFTDAQVIFSSADHLPKYEDVPVQFKSASNRYLIFISSWFFEGRTKEDMQRLVEKPGVDRTEAIRAIQAAMASWEPKHEHKISGCAYLLSEWFTLNN